MMPLRFPFLQAKHFPGSMASHVSRSYPMGHETHASHRRVVAFPYRPPGHVEHSRASVSDVFPREHPKQPVSLRFGANLPAGHAKHNVVSFLGLNLPTVQSSHDSDPHDGCCLPAGQDRHSPAHAGGPNLPGGHLSHGPACDARKTNCPARHAKQYALPSLPWCFPCGHNAHHFSPWREVYLPGLHGWHPFAAER